MHWECIYNIDSISSFNESHAGIDTRRFNYNPEISPTKCSQKTGNLLHLKILSKNLKKYWQQVAWTTLGFEEIFLLFDEISVLTGEFQKILSIG